MRVFLLIAALALVSCQPAPQQNALVGAWRLVSYTDTPEGGAPVMEFGERPGGMFVFSADGHAAFNIMRNPPAPEATSTSVDPDACTPAWYCSYFGTYTVDWSAHTWTLHVEGGNIASFIGTDQTRPFRIEGDRLIIEASYDDEAGRHITAERVLERAR